MCGLGLCRKLWCFKAELLSTVLVNPGVKCKQIQLDCYSEWSFKVNWRCASLVLNSVRTGVMGNEWRRADCPWILTSFIRKRVIRRRPNAFDGANPQRPIKIISEGTYPTAAAVLEGAGSPTVLLIGAVTTVVEEVAGLPRSEVAAVIAGQQVSRKRRTQMSV